MYCVMGSASLPKNMKHIDPECYENVLINLLSGRYDPDRIIVLSGLIKTYEDGAKELLPDPGYTLEGQFHLPEDSGGEIRGSLLRFGRKSSCQP